MYRLDKSSPSVCGKLCVCVMHLIFQLEALLVKTSIPYRLSNNLPISIHHSLLGKRGGAFLPLLCLELAQHIRLTIRVTFISPPFGAFILVFCIGNSDRTCNEGCIQSFLAQLKLQSHHLFHNVPHGLLLFNKSICVSTYLRWGGRRCCANLRSVFRRPLPVPKGKEVSLASYCSDAKGSTT